MTFQMVDAYDRQISRKRKRFCHVDADDQRSAQTRSACNGNGVQIAHLQVSVL